MASSFPYYCSQLDVKDELMLHDFGSNTFLTEARILTAIGKAFGEINAKAAKGGYTVPVENTVQQDVTGALVAAASNVDIAVSDGTAFSVGKTLRIHGKATNNWQDEFQPIVAISSNTLSVPVLRNSYDDSPDPTAEQCLTGFLALRDCNAKGAALKLLRGLTARTQSSNAKLDALAEAYEMCLTDLAEGNISLEGLTIGNSVAVSFQTENSDDSSVDPVITRTRKF